MLWFLLCVQPAFLLCIPIISCHLRFVDKTTSIDEFYSEKKDNHYIYTLVNEYISADINYYNIKPELSGANNNYYYKIEDNNIF